MLSLNFTKTIQNRFFNKRYISQHKLRKYLLNNKDNNCVLCNNYFPYKILEAAHLKPRKILNKKENDDYNNVEFMCRNCHKFYDLGLITVFNGTIIKSKELLNYDYNLTNKYIDNYNYKNALYYKYHFNDIFKKK